MLTSYNSLVRSRGVPATSSVTKADAGHNVFPFLSLPAEIRNMIYEYCLVRGKVYTARKIPRSWKHLLGKEADWLDYNSPKSSLAVVTLLGVSTQIRAEAQAVFYSQNTFVITLGDEDGRNTFLRFGALINYVQSVELIFSYSDWNESDSFVLHEGSAQLMPFLEDEEEQREKQECLHDFRIEFLLENQWSFDSGRYSYLTSSRLKHLTINIEEAYCPTSCCRLAEVWFRTYALISGFTVCQRVWRLLAHTANSNI